jgi:hypothetical protein
MGANQRRLPVSYLPIAVRGLTFTRIKYKKGKRWLPDRPPTNILAFDVETTTDHAQKLNFGSYLWGNPTTLDTIAEGLFYADDLPKRDPSGFACLKKYVDSCVVSPITGKKARLELRSRTEFVNEIFYKASYKSRAMVVGFNLPFDISRLAVNSGLARGFYRGGFCFTLSEYKDAHGKFREDLWKPRIAIKAIDSKRSFIGFLRPSKFDPENVDEFFPGYFLDLKTLGWALTNKAGGLASMCKTFGVEHGKDVAPEHGKISTEYIAYNLHDVRATVELYQKLRAEFELHPIDLEPYRTYSPASMGKNYLRAINLIPPRKKFRNISPDKLAKTMSAFFGGRAECKFRGIVPVGYCDFLSEYPTVNVLLGLWPYLTAEQLKIVDCTEEVRRFLANTKKEDLSRPGSWRKLDFFAKIKPTGDILPVRARYQDENDALNIAVNPFTSPTSLYYAGPDLVASTLLSGKPPIIERAIRFVPVGVQTGLRPSSIRGTVPVDPVKQDFFQTPVEERQLIKKGLKDGGQSAAADYLKVLANSSSYGIYAEMNRVELIKPRTITAYGIYGPFQHPTQSPEELGEFCFPPIAALIASAARLMLALLERCVTDAGGSFASCDTDSMTIIATEKGGPIMVKAGDKPSCRFEYINSLSWGQIDEIVKLFEQLNPYDRRAVPGSLLKIEDENFDPETGDRRQLFGCFLASKRYAFFNYTDEDEIIIRKISEHGLGHILNPLNHEVSSKKWMEKFWMNIIHEELGKPVIRPDWFDRPAISQESITTPRLLKPFLRRNRRLQYSDRIKPFNFVLSAHLMPGGRSEGLNPKKCHLIAPYTPNPNEWLKVQWVDIHSGRAVRITTKVEASPAVARVKSIGDVYDEYKTHPESKSAGPDGKPCGPHTRGPLYRRDVHAAYVRLVGKESNKLDEVEHETVPDWEDVREEYLDPKLDTWTTLIVPVLKLMPREDLARIVRISPRAIQALRNGHGRPSRAHRTALIRAAGDYARKHAGLNIRDDLCACAAFLNSGLQ